MKNTILLIPADAWDTLHQSLVLDTESAGVDRPLREQLKAALAQVQNLTEPVTALLNVSEEIPRCAFIRNDDIKHHVIGDERMERLKLALRFFRSSFEINGGHRCYRKQLV